MKATSQVSTPGARRVEAEWLDTLPASSEAARRSRADLQRINTLMGHAPILRRHLRNCLPEQAGEGWQVAELGAGDARFTAKVWRRLPAPPPGSQLWLIDQQGVADPEALAVLAKLGWDVRWIAAEATEWIGQQSASSLHLVYANLFVHHFEGTALNRLLQLLESACGSFVALEPRRGNWGEWGVRGLRFLGCHPVTLHDALVSVRAGFRDSELSAQWPNAADWNLCEWPAGLFSHAFVARSRRCP